MAAAREPGDRSIPGAARVTQARTELNQASTQIIEAFRISGIDINSLDMAYEECYNSIYRSDHPAVAQRRTFMGKGLNALRVCAEAIKLGNRDALDEFKYLFGRYLRVCAPIDRELASVDGLAQLIDGCRDWLPYTMHDPRARSREADGGKRRTRRTRRHHRK